MKSISKALYIIDDNEHPYAGWTFDPRGLERRKRGHYVRFDFDKTDEHYESILRRKFRKQTDSIVTLELNFTTNVQNGFLIALYSEDGSPAVGIRTKDNGFTLLDGTQLGVPLEAGVKTSFKTVIDIVEHTYTIAVANVFCGAFSLPESVCDLASIATGIESGFVGHLSLHGVKMYTDYLVCERFLAPYDGITPYDMIFTGEGTVGGTVSSIDNTFSKEDIYYYRIISGGHDALLSKPLKNAVGDLAFEIKFIDTNGELDAFFGLDDCGVTAKNGVLSLSDGTPICAYPMNLWNTLRIEYASDGILIRLNGKDKGIFDISRPFVFHNLCIAVCKNSDVGIDDILVFPLLPLPDDYVSEPHPVPSKEPYHVGGHVFSSWHYGFWRGTHDATWDVCTPFDEITPYMGYYDEGIPEVSDWEVKWMSEHGIDFQLQCWYGPENITEPIKFSGFSHALHDGYFNSVYKEYCKFAIMWENNFTKNITLDAFKKYLVPYFIEYYFKDPNYYVIDGKPVFSIYNIGKLQTTEYFCDENGVKEAIAFLRQAAKKAGFADVIVLCAAGFTDILPYMQNIGIDGSYNYSLGTMSFTADFQQTVFESVLEKFDNKSTSLAYIPTISVGFNWVARNNERYPSISMPEYDKISHWVRDEMLQDKRRVGDEKSWQRNMVLLSCWNEFDEGHYINPTNLHGFGFLDTIRRTFTDAPDNHTDERPTDLQKKRIGVLFPEGHAWLRPERRLMPPKPSENCKVINVWDFSKEEDAAQWDFFINAHDKQIKDGALYGRSDGIHPQIICNAQISIPTSQITTIHMTLRAKNADGEPSPCYSRIFFATDVCTEITEMKMLRDYYEPNGDCFVDLYMSTAEAFKWMGNLTYLKLYPIPGAGTFEIGKIELLYAPSNQVVTINSKRVDTRLPFQVIGSVPFIPLFAASPLTNLLDFAYRWNRAKGELTLLVKDRTLVFTVGSDKAIIDGEIVSLAGSVPLVDGVPAIPFDVLCYEAGYGYEFDGIGKVAVTTD